MSRTMNARRDSDCGCGAAIHAGDLISKVGRRWVGECCAARAAAMTAEKATRFDHYSERNAESVQEQSMDSGCDGSCEAYVTIFTVRRWEAQGFEPRADEAPAIAESWRTKKDDDGNIVARWKRTYEVWCRHQVEPIPTGSDDQAQEAEHEHATRDALAEHPELAEVLAPPKRRSFSPPQIPALEGFAPLGIRSERG